MYLVQHFEDDEAHACRPHSYYGRAEELCQQEAASTTIEQCPSSVAKSPVRIVPRQPQTPCTDDAPTGSSIFSTCVDEVDCKYHYHAANGTDKYRSEGDTRSHPAVTPTSPASTPFSVRDKEGLPYLIQLTTSAKKPPGTSCQVGGKEHVRDGCLVSTVCGCQAANQG